MLVNHSGISSTSVEAPELSSGTTYYRRLMAINADGDIVCFKTWEFTTQAAEPAVPELVFPSDQSGGVPTPPELSWNPSEGAVWYRVQVSESENFEAAVFDQEGIASTSATVTELSFGTIYYWRV